MKTAFTTAVLCAGLVGTAQAGEWTTSPYQDPEWSPDFTLAATAGPMDVDVSGVGSDTAVGAQFSMNCPWFSPPAGNIRQQFNYNRFDNDGLKLQTFEMNPRWFGGSGRLTYGAGPGIGYVRTNPDDESSDSMWAFQVGADVEYRHGALFAGAGVRQQFTSGGDADNLLGQVKVGVNF
ncbi:hypothetical protein [Thioalkalivibrio sp. ALJ24]|uniref:hypothetical protein n=1 Tax=Thioalkalivibrio sp. ALJ24 TaxID=545276 RepID=UPI000367E969|nr:hypothetical protein [Thioalkalivibrio sp. ALJ24]